MPSNAYNPSGSHTQVWSVPVAADGTASTNNPNANPATAYNAQRQVTASAAQLSAQALTNGVTIKASPDNTGNVFIGGSGVTTTANGSGNGYMLTPGESVSYAIQNTNALYVIATVNPSVIFLAGS